MGTINTAHHHTTTTASSSSSSSFSTATAKLDALLFLLELVSFYLSHSPCTTIAHLQHCLQKCVIAPFSIKYNTIQYNTIQCNTILYKREHPYCPFPPPPPNPTITLLGHQHYPPPYIAIASFHNHHNISPQPHYSTSTITEDV